MRIVTLQTREVLDIIKRKGVYEVNSRKLKSSRLKQNYKVMRGFMNTYSRRNNPKLPIWCYLKINGEDPLPDLLDNIYQINQSCSSIKDNSVVLELEVPNNKVFLTDYYSWTDYLYFFNDDYDKEGFTRALSNLKDYDLDDTVQATIFKITEDMLIEVYY